jgi:hypothetical protein
MAELRFTMPVRQMGGRGPVSLATLAIVTLGLGLLGHRLVQVIVSGIVWLILLWFFVKDARAFTECTTDGIRTRGMDGRRQCPWPLVANIAIRSFGRSGHVVVVTMTDFRQFSLGAPFSRAAAPGPQFMVQFEEIVHYWHAAWGSASAGEPTAS